MRISNREIFGSLVIFASAWFFYLSTVSILWAKSEVQLPSFFFVFARFFLGFIVVTLVVLFKKESIKPVRFDLILWRTITNVIAVFFFFHAVTVTSVAEANILNMTYPLFIALISWFVLKKTSDKQSYFMVLLAFAGIWLILSPKGGIQLRAENLWGLGSGIVAAFAIILLNKSRLYDHTNTILFYLFGIGSILIFIFFYSDFFIPNQKEIYYLAICATTGVIGQYLLTIGFRYVNPVEGSIISSTRILLAALLGPYIASDLPLTSLGWIGSLLIFSTNVYLAWKKAH
jgi:drug/metabolite transporter (DMT)-like permease